MIEPWVVVTLVVVGATALVTATVVSAREDEAVAGRGGSRLAPVVPWLGSLLVVVLLVRGSLTGAAVVGVVTLVHAVVTRVRIATSRR